MRVLFDLTSWRFTGKSATCFLLPEGKPSVNKYSSIECLLHFCYWPDLVLVAIWNAKKCVISVLEELSPVGEIPPPPA